MHEQVINMSEERKMAAVTSSRLAEMYADRREWSKAIEFYKEAISFDDRDSMVC